MRARGGERGECGGDGECGPERASEVSAGGGGDAGECGSECGGECRPDGASEMSAVVIVSAVSGDEGGGEVR